MPEAISQQCVPARPSTPDEIIQRRRKRIVVALYSAYGDESSDEKSERVFSVAAIFGTQQEWDTLSLAWFDRTGGIDFHAAQCDSDSGEFSVYSHAENKKLYRDLTRLLCSTKLVGHSLAISIEASKKYFPAAPQESSYYLCFVHVIVKMAELGYLSLNQGTVKMVFDHNLDKEFGASHLYQYMARLEEWKSHPYLDGEVGFASRKGNAQIQAADLVAREAMKELDNRIGPVKRWRRASMDALLRTGRFFFKILGEAEFANLVRKADELGKRLVGSKESEYQAWLSEHHYPDNHEMKINYLMRIDELNRPRRSKD